MALQSARDIINRWKSPEALAERIRAKPETVRKWRQRNRIPSEWWTRIVEAERGRIDAITLEDLASLGARSDSELQDTGT